MAPGKPAEDPAAAEAPATSGAHHELARDARDFHRAVSRLIRVYQAMDRQDICCYDVSVSQCWALEAICDHGPLTLNELAGRLLLDKSTTSRVVTALERKGYATRRRHPEEGRTVQLEPTAAGRDLRRTIESDILARDGAILQDLDPEVRRSVTRTLDELARVARRGPPPSDGGSSCCDPT